MSIMHVLTNRRKECWRQIAKANRTNDRELLTRWRAKLLEVNHIIRLIDDKEERHHVS